MKRKLKSGGNWINCVDECHPLVSVHKGCMYEYASLGEDIHIYST